VTTISQSRKKAVKSVRRRDQAEAFSALKKILDNLAKIQSDLEQTRKQIASIQNDLDSASAARGTILANRLRMDSLRRERMSAELGNLKKIEKDLAGQAHSLEIEADTARDGAAKAHKAYIALGGDHNK
jgi:chromosome segregation ATPase